MTILDNIFGYGIPDYMNVAKANYLDNIIRTFIFLVILIIFARKNKMIEVLYCVLCISLSLNTYVLIYDWCKLIEAEKSRESVSIIEKISGFPIKVFVCIMIGSLLYIIIKKTSINLKVFIVVALINVAFSAKILHDCMYSSKILPVSCFDKFGYLKTFIFVIFSSGILMVVHWQSLATKKSKGEF